MLHQKRRNPTRGWRVSRSDRLAGTTAPESKLDTLEQQAVAVCDGQRLFGLFATVNGSWRAWRADGIPLGVLPSRDEARAAIIKVGQS